MCKSFARISIPINVESKKQKPFKLVSPKLGFQIISLEQNVLFRENPNNAFPAINTAFYLLVWL